MVPVIFLDSGTDLFTASGLEPVLAGAGSTHLFRSLPKVDHLVRKWGTERPTAS